MLLRLVFLQLQNNQLSGPLPSSISNCSRLRSNLSSQLNSLGLYGNHLHGNLPRSIGKLVGLERLILGGNQFAGNIPSTIGNLQKLQHLYLGENKLSGQIPDAMGNLSSLISLHLFSNMLEGVIPSSLGNCHRLLELYIDDNKLNGKIPTKLLQLSSLSITLNLSKNKLFGSLPTEVGDLKMLTTLNLSDNNLSGDISSSLGGCVSMSRQIPKFLEHMWLEHLDLSYNDFEGEIPVLGVFANVSAFSVLGNSRLCGGIVELGLPKCKKTKRQLFKATNGFSESNLIGKGGFSSVYRGNLYEDDDTFVVVKILHLQIQGAQRSFMRLEEQLVMLLQVTIYKLHAEYGVGCEMTSSGDVYSFGILVLEVMTRKRPPDEIFKEGLSLHKFASMALRDNNVTDIIDVNIINVYQEEAEVIKEIWKETNMETIIEECVA
ncbi:hypothetical protein E3N88_13183 [Mikania micrantha]|uniref:Disease resistance R13L4/SHOC-2-like LRR domain-containing protein n=1 Tax=Mikania micrantha TaxID=192012 RepID=A0A5N6P9K5_9ASTR|nr:hypothetical protein E3N88_13183 [Mikania micrantha]